MLVLVFVCYIMFVFGDFTLGDSSGNLPQRLEQKRTFENWKTNELILLRPMKQKNFSTTFNGSFAGTNAPTVGEMLKMCSARYVKKMHSD